MANGSPRKGSTLYSVIGKKKKDCDVIKLSAGEDFVGVSILETLAPPQPKTWHVGSGLAPQHHEAPPDD